MSGLRAAMHLPADVVIAGVVAAPRVRMCRHSNPNPVAVARFVASETNTTWVPSPEMRPSMLAALPGALAAEPLTREVVAGAVQRFRTNTSGSPLVSPATRFDANEVNTT